MGLLGNKVDRQELMPGDHIYAWRHGYIYAHHGIYVGDGKVIHFTQGAAGQNQNIGINISSSFPRSSSHPCPHCGFNSRASGVILSCIDCFLTGGYPKLYLFEYGVSPAYFLAKVRGGTCTLATSDPPEDVRHRANVLPQIGFGDYDVFKNNCEDFAIYCKTGLLVMPTSTAGLSGQAASFGTAAGILTSLAGLAARFGGLAAVAASGVHYSCSRLASDIGRRRDVERVPVERLVARSSSSQVRD